MLGLTLSLAISFCTCSSSQIFKKFFFLSFHTRQLLTISECFLLLFSVKFGEKVQVFEKVSSSFSVFDCLSLAILDSLALISSCVRMYIGEMLYEHYIKLTIFLEFGLIVGRSVNAEISLRYFSFFLDFSRSWMSDWYFIRRLRVSIIFFIYLKIFLII